MSPRSVEPGKRWLAHVFEQISTELKDRVVVEHWLLLDNDAEYRLWFQIAGQAKSDAFVFTRGTVRTCGHPAHDGVAGVIAIIPR